MSTYQPNINPSSPEGQALQASIQKQLASLEWSTEDDSTMAEYCLVMLGNRKTPEQISTELSDLIGGDFDQSFVTWLFEEVKNHYPEPTNSTSASPSSAAAPSAPSAPSAQAQGTAPAASSNGLPARPTGGRSMFGAAVTGMKRDNREMGSEGSREPPHQRQRFDGTNGRNGGGKSLFDRMGGNNAQFAPGPRNNAALVNNLGMPQAAFDAISQTIQAVNSGAHPSSLASIPFPALAAHPLSSTLPPQVLAQAQAHAMAQAQAFAQMQNVWSTPPAAFGAPAGGPSGFNPQATPFNPAGAPFGGSSSGPNGFRGSSHLQHQQAQQQSRQGRTSKTSGPPVVLPKKPELEAICKHGVECTKPQCGFSHPSPVATKESGLVLSSEACEKQLACEDPDCPKSHVSKAQKTVPPSGATSQSADPAVPSTTSATTQPSNVDPSTIPGAGTKPCKFGSACTRPGCVFMHPWDVRGDTTGGTVPCRYGAACTRAGCHFSHPPKASQTFNRSKFSATFNKPSPATPATTDSTSTPAKASVGEWPKENPQHVSERLKRFAAQNGGGEKIIPGQPQNSATTEGEAGKGADKVEIHFEDDEEKEKGKKEATA